MANKMVYFFGGGKGEGNAKMKNLLGGKGANLAEMAKLGVPVPPGFTITTEVCTHFYQNKKKYPKGLKEKVDEAMRRIEKIMGKKFGDPVRPPSDVRPLRRPQVDARNDGNCVECRTDNTDNTGVDCEKRQ